MQIKTTHFSRILPVIVLIILCLYGCSIQSTQEPTVEVIPTEISIPTKTQIHIPKPTYTIVTTETPTPTSPQIYVASSTPTPTIDPTYQAWHATAKSVKETAHAISLLASHQKATQIAQFPYACEYINNSDISPDGQWLATSCGYKENQTLIVQKKEETKWILEFKDFVSPDISGHMMGLLKPKYWGAEGVYLYYTTGLGYSGGGSQCFTYNAGDYGLFRLNLKTGLWVTLIPPIDNFPGYILRFSPSGEHYAIGRNGLTITDLQTGKFIQIETQSLTNFIWSPDGTYLAYSVAKCGEFLVQSSAVYIWNAQTNQQQKLLTADDILLLSESWIDNTTSRVIGEQIIDRDTLFTVYEYNLEQKGLTFNGTATPFP